MTGPLDGEIHHWFNGKVWTKNIQGKRCHWKHIPSELQSALKRFKPEGGSFVITCWGNIAALIQPKPLPPEAREQWSKLSEDEKRLLQIKQKSIQMLPIFLGKFNSEWEIVLENPVIILNLLAMKKWLKWTISSHNMGLVKSHQTLTVTNNMKILLKK